MAICIACNDGKEYKSLSVHMQKKHGDAKSSEQPTEQVVNNVQKITKDVDTTSKEFVSREEFNQMLELMKTMIEQNKAKDAPAPSSLKAAQEMSEGPKPGRAPVDPKWRKIVDSILGPDFGVDVVYPSRGSGFLFKIIVPLSKSNAGESHLSYYKSDVRTKAVSMGDAESGITEHCKKIKANLTKSNQNKI